MLRALALLLRRLRRPLRRPLRRTGAGDAVQEPASSVPVPSRCIRPRPPLTPPTWHKYWDEWEARKERSLALLDMWLSPEQRQSFERDGWFTVKGNATGTVYRLLNTTVFNVQPENESSLRYCVQPKGCSSTIGDLLLAQKIWLETDELATLDVASQSIVWWGNEVYPAAG